MLGEMHTTVCNVEEGKGVRCPPLLLFIHIFVAGSVLEPGFYTFSARLEAPLGAGIIGIYLQEGMSGLMLCWNLLM